ncbi:MAG: tetratricopeptide repeat protein [Candidatus Methylumidiphilus sp.]
MKPTHRFPTKKTKPHKLDLGDALALAVQIHREGRLAEAEELYRRILLKSPTQADACHFLGVLLHQTGRSAEGIASIKRALADNPDYIDAHNNLGNLHKETGNLPEAVAAYRAVIRLDPKHAGALNNLGIVLKDQGDMDEAIASLQTAIALAPDNADYQRNLGHVYRRQGKVAETAEAYRKALSLATYDPDAYEDLRRRLYQIGAHDEAEKVLRQWLDIDPNHPVALHSHAAHAGGENVPQRASDEYVRRIFDGFAGSFDQVLDGLNYHAPQLVAEAVAAFCPEPANRLDVLDAGCGTGLCGPLLRPYAASLTGVDLSPKMLEKAAQRQVYEVLAESELVEYLRGRQAAFDLIVSADTLVYFGELRAFFEAAAVALRPGGHLVFSLEKWAEGEGFKLNYHGRYSHAQSYAEAELSAASLHSEGIEEAVLRMEAGEPVFGLLVTAGKHVPR